MFQFDDFSVTLTSLEDGRIAVAVNDPVADQVVQEVISLPFNKSDVEVIRLTIEKFGATCVKETDEAARRALHRSASSEADALLQKRGKELFDSLFCGRVKESLRRQYIRSHAGARGLRIRLRLDNRLALYPFEIAYCSEAPVHQCHLALQTNVSIVRSLQDMPLVETPAITPPLRILVVVASPKGVGGLVVDSEIQNIHRALNLPGIRVDTISGHNTLGQLNTRVGSDCNVFHFIGHGMYDADDQTGYILFENNDGQPVRIAGPALNARLAGIRNLRLVTLNCCRGSRANETEISSGVATSIFRAGMPAVVAMQNDITNSAAVEFTKELYSLLALGRTIDQAMALARNTIQLSGEPTSPEWATPVLYLATANGDLFGLRHTPEELLKHVRTLLQNRDWPVASNVAQLILEQPDLVPRDREEALRLDALARGCTKFVNAWRAFADDSEPTEVLDRHNSFSELATAARDFRVDALDKLTAEITAAHLDLRTAVDIVRAIVGGDFDGVDKLLQQPPDSKVIDFSQLRKIATQEQATRQLLSEFNVHWNQGDLESLTRFRGILPTTRPERATDPRYKTASALTEALGEVKSDNFRRAKEILERIPADHRPPNLDKFCRIVELGEQAVALGSQSDLDKIERLAHEFDQFRSAGGTLAIPGQDRVGQVIERVSLEGRYRAGIQAYAAGLFSAAQTCFSRVADYKDSLARAELCRLWDVAANEFEQRNWSGARKALESLEAGEKALDPRESGDRIRVWRQWSVRAPQVVPVLRRMASGPVVCDFSIAWEGGACPYKVLEPLGIMPHSTIQQADDVGFAAQQKPGGMTRGDRNAWDAIRLIEKRLTVDFGLYAVEDPARVQLLLDRLCNYLEGRDVGLPTPKIAAELGDDRGVFHALLRNYDQAIEFFRQRAQANPNETRHLHHLGLSAAGKIQLLKDQAGQEDELADAWDDLNYAFGTVFADDRFWNRWWSLRRQIYANSLTGENISDARLRLQRHWFEQIKSAADISPGLDMVFQAELYGARAVQAGGGIPIHDGAAATERVIVGPRGAAALGLDDYVARWVASFPPEIVAARGWQQNVCRYFSPLGLAAALFEEGRLDEAISQSRSAIERDSTTRGAGASALSLRSDGPALLRALHHELLEQSHAKLALAAVSEMPMPVARVLSHWKSAVESARARGSDERMLDEIREVACGRSAVLWNDASVDEEKKERSLQGLNDAVQLLSDVLDQGWDNAKAVLITGLVEALLNRAVFLSNAYDLELEAKRDAQRACSLAPHSMRANVVLCQAILHYANELVMGGSRAEAQALCTEAEMRLADVKKQYANHVEVAKCEKHLQYVSKVLSGSAALAGQSMARDERLMKEAGCETVGDPAVAASSKLTEAMIKQVQHDYEGALTLYDEILKANPTNQDALARIPWCYRAWFVYSCTTVNAPKKDVRSIVEQALKRFPGHPALTDLAGELIDNPEEKH